MRRPYTYTNQVFKVNFGNILYFSSPQADWSQEDENAPNYIKNKPNLVAGDNITLTKEGNDIIISATGTIVNPDNPDNPDIPDQEDTVIEEIIKNEIPMYFGFEGEGEEAVEFKLLDGTTAAYTDNGFYTITQNSKTSAGYQFTFKGTFNEAPQVVLFPQIVKIASSYQYQPVMNQWLYTDFDGTYWVESGEVTKVINGEELIYIKYVYNSELWGDPIVVDEYWRFEVEV